MTDEKKKKEIKIRFNARYAKSHEELIDRYRKWLYIEPRDIEFIETGLAWLLDREIEGDPVWGMLIAPSGGIKSEILRSFCSYPRSYSLDTLTKSTLVSGMAQKDKFTGEMVPVAGIMQDLDGMVLVLKDFTTVLSTNEDTRTEIYGQLRSAYDGYFEKAFGTMRRKVSVHSTFGIVAGVTPIIDKYTRLHNLLGERFLYIRSSPNRKLAALKANRNTGQEVEMRAQLAGSVASYIEHLVDAGRFKNSPKLSEEHSSWMINLADYVALMRCRVFTNYEGGDLKSMEVVGIEIPTRISKQFNKSLRLLAVVREHEEIESEDFLTLQRIAKDTVISRRQKIMDVFAHPDIDFVGKLTTNDISGRAEKMYYRTVNNECRIMNVLGILEYDQNNGLYWPSEDFIESIYSAYNLPEGYTLPRVHSEKKPENSSFSEQTPPRVLTPDTPEGKLVDFATKLLTRHDNEMDRALFFNTLYEAHYHQNDVENVLRGNPQFIFTEETVKVKDELDEFLYKPEENQEADS